MLFNRCRSFCQRVMDSVPISGKRRAPTAYEDLLARFRQGDHSRNAESTPPPEETIELCCVWAAEIYTPAHTESLAQALRNFDQETRTTSSVSGDLASWFEGTQRQLYGGAMCFLGTWVPKGEADSWIIRDRIVNLPAAVKYANGMMFSLSSTLTCIVVCFVLNEEMSDCYDSSLKSDRETFLTPNAGGASFHMPINQKSDDIWRLRSELSKMAQTWFRENLPGAFSSQMDELAMPTCELITFSDAIPFPDTDEPTTPLYVRLLGLDGHGDAWKYSDLPGLRFGFHSRPKKGPNNHATLAINLRHWWEANPDRESHDAKSSLLSYVNWPVPELMSIWAIEPLLQNFAENLVRIQNSTVFHAGQGEDYVEVLRQLTNHVSSLSDLSAVSADLDERNTKRNRPLFMGSPFTPVRTGRHAGSTTLDIALWRSIKERAKWLGSTDRNIRDRLSQIGAFVGAQENVRLQKKVSALTWVILVVTILAIVVTVCQPLLQEWVLGTAQEAIDQLRNASASRSQ